MQGLNIKYTDKQISPWGGIRFVEETYRKSGLRDYFRKECKVLPEVGSNRGYDPVDLIEGFMISTILGATRLSHSGLLRHDEVIQKIFGWKKGMASQSTFSRFFKKFNLERNDSIFTGINKFWFSQLKLDKMTIDVDSTVITRHGSQEGVEKGYNPKSHGRGSHHPLIAFVAEANMVANAWLRPGNTASSTDCEEFLDELFAIIPTERIGLLRADSGFSIESIMSKLENDEVKYIMAMKLRSPMISLISDCKNWFPQGDGYWTTNFMYQAAGWSKPRKIVVVRKDCAVNPNTGGKLLFPEIEEFESFKYSAFVTNVEFSDEMIWHLYNRRADCENRIKELKYEYGIEGFCMEDFWATEAAFRFTMVAHNLMALFRLTLLNKKHQPTLPTIKLQCIAIGSYLAKKSRKTSLVLSAKDKKRQFLENLFEKATNLAPPFQIPKV